MASTLPTVADCCDDCVGSSTVSLTGTVGWFSVDDLAALRALAANSTNTWASVGTGAAFIGLFRWDAASVTADDGITVINPTGNTGSGRWVKLL